MKYTLASSHIRSGPVLAHAGGAGECRGQGRVAGAGGTWKSWTARMPKTKKMKAQMPKTLDCEPQPRAQYRASTSTWGGRAGPAPASARTAAAAPPASAAAGTT
eukprot:3219286-Rhodomonas_salina.1